MKHIRHVSKEDLARPLMRGRFAWEKVAPFYQEHHRVYHGIAHIHAMLRMAADSDLTPDQHRWMSAVIWLHDAYHDPVAIPPFNEMQSADLLDGEMGEAFTPIGRELAREAILASAHHTRDQYDLHPLVAHFLDLDLAKVAADDTDFNRQTRAVAEEFRRSGKSTEKITDAHAQFCMKLLNRARLFYLEKNRGKEAKARQNLGRVVHEPLMFV